MRTLTVLGYAALCPLAACMGSPPAPAQTRPLVLADVSVIDGTGAPPRPGHTVLVDSGRIVAVFPTGSRTLPANARSLDVAGSYVVPGLIDSHVHLASFERPPEMLNALLRFALLGGVTTVRDMGGNPTRVAALARASRAPDAPLPRIFFSAVAAGPSWFASYDAERLRFWSGAHAPGSAPGVRLVSDTTNLAALVRQAASMGATGIKVYAGLAPERLAALAAEAHGQGLRVWSHAVVPPSRPGDVVASGADAVSHADQLVWAVALSEDSVGDRAVRRRLLRENPPDVPAVTAVLHAMRERGVLLEPTLLVMQMGRVRDDGTVAPLDTLPAWAVGVTRHANRLGVPIVAGTDALGTETPNIHAELQLLVDQAGLTPLEALRAATQRGAEALGLADSTGTIAPGKWADLVVLHADPAADIRNTQTVRYVIRGGQVHERTGPWEVPPLARPPALSRKPDPARP